MSDSEYGLRTSAMSLVIVAPFLRIVSSLVLLELEWRLRQLKIFQSKLKNDALVVALAPNP